MFCYDKLGTECISVKIQVWGFQYLKLFSVNPQSSLQLGIQIMKSQSKWAVLIRLVEVLDCPLHQLGGFDLWMTIYCFTEWKDWIDSSLQHSQSIVFCNSEIVWFEGNWRLCENTQKKEENLGKWPRFSRARGIFQSSCFSDSHVRMSHWGSS